MGLTILERLKDEEPRGKSLVIKNPTLNAIYDLCRKHQAEIEEARERGYSWTQIDAVCREVWEKNGTLPKNITWWRSDTMVESCYRAVKKGTTANASPKKREKPLSLEVTVTKR